MGREVGRNGPRKVERKEYPSFEGIVDDGWIVD